MEKRISETGLKMIACHKAKPTPIGSNYIYLKIHQNAKRANYGKKICPFEKMISQDFILDMKPAIYSRYQRFGVDDFKA